MSRVLSLRQSQRARTDRARNVHDEVLRSVVGFFIKGLETSKNEAEGVDDDAGATGGDAGLRYENDQVGENEVDFLDRVEGRSALAKKIDGEIGGVGIAGYLGGVFAAEAAERIGRPSAAAAAAVGDVGATVVG